MTTATDYRKKAEDYRNRQQGAIRMAQDTSNQHRALAASELGVKYEIMAATMDATADMLEDRKESAHESG